MERGGTSFLLFAGGAIVPVIPLFFVGGIRAAIYSAVLSAVAMFIIGAGTTLFTGRNIIWSGLRQLAIGVGAAAITFALGRLIGVAVTG